jgi:hypothetical protein
VELIRHRCNTMVCRVAPKGGDAKGGRKASEEKSGHSTAKTTKQPCSKSATVGCKMCEKQVGCSHCKPICIASSRFSADLRGRVDLPGATPLFDVAERRRSNLRTWWTSTVAAPGIICAPPVRVMRIPPLMHTPARRAEPPERTLSRSWCERRCHGCRYKLHVQCFMRCLAQGENGEWQAQPATCDRCSQVCLFHICSGTGRTPATSAPGVGLPETHLHRTGSPLPDLRRNRAHGWPHLQHDRARRFRICTYEKKAGIRPPT